MVEIKDLYKTTHEVTLADDIRKHYTGDTKNILLALIKGSIFRIKIVFLRLNL
jgi:hypothetical protein